MTTTTSSAPDEAPALDGVEETTAEPVAVTVYEPTTVTLRGIPAYLRSVWARRPLIWNLTRSDLKAENYDTVLGQVWLILNPLLLALTYLFVRGIIRPMGTPEERNDLIAHLIMAVFFFHYTSDTLNPGARSIVGNRQMVLNTAVPRGAFPVVKLLRGVLDFIPMLLVYFAIHAIFGQPFTTAMLWLPAFIVAQTMFTFGLVLFFAALSVFFRDTLNVLRYIIRVWLFATPVLYTVDEIPERFRTLFELNPLFPLFASYEQIFDGVDPDPGYLLWAFAWAVAALLVGAVYFLVKERDFAPRL